MASGDLIVSGGAGLEAFPPPTNDFNLRSASPRAMATIDLGAGDDEFDDDGWVLPPGSTITGLP